MQIQKVNNQTSFGNIRNVNVLDGFDNAGENAVNGLKNLLTSPDFYLLDENPEINDIGIYYSPKMVYSDSFGWRNNTNHPEEILVGATRIETTSQRGFLGRINKIEKEVAYAGEYGNPKNFEDYMVLVKKALVALQKEVNRKNGLKEIKQLTRK